MQRVEPCNGSILMEHPTIKTIQCRGTPWEIGLAHGRAAAREIMGSISTYSRFFQETAQLDWSQAREKASDIFIPVLRAKYPDILAEMQGVAEGAGQGLMMEDILTLNTRSEIALTNYADGCTSIAQPGVNHEMLLCQNWDWLEEVREEIVFLHVYPVDGHHMKFISEAGIVGKIGSNSAGLGIGMNALRSGAFNRGGFPVHILSRWLLQHCSTVQEARAAVERFNTGCTATYMLADRAGSFEAIEASPHGNIVIQPSDRQNYVVHTNHLYGSGRPAKLVEHPAPNSFHRLKRIRSLTERDNAAGVPPSFESLRRRLSDEEGYPYSICRDRPPGAHGMERMTTLATVSMELVSGKMEITVGRPCLTLPVIRWQLDQQNPSLT